MRILRLDEATLEECAREACEVFARGGVILFPTDTLYGLGADATNSDAVDKIYAIKGREEGKPMHGIVSDMSMVDGYATVTKNAEKIAHEFFPGPLTLILPKKATFTTGIGRGIATFGVRIPDSLFCRETARVFGKPFTATSANKSGEESKRNVGEILSQLGAGALHIDLVLNMGELPVSAPSTVVDCTGESPKVLREGVISETAIMQHLRETR